MVSKKLLKIAIGLLVLLSLFSAALNFLDPDLGWHLRVGGEILTNRDAPRGDTLSHTMPGYPWVDHEWFTNLIWAAAHAHGVWPAVVMVFMALVIIPFVVWLKRSKSFLELWFIGLTGVMAQPYIGIRAHLVTFFFLFLEVEILLKRKFFWLLPFLFLLWANMHGGFLVGLGIFALYLAADFWHKRKISWQFLIFAASAGATFLNPYGFGIYEEVFRVMLSSDTAKFINEWQPGLLWPTMAATVPLQIFTWIGQMLFLGSFLVLIFKYRKKLPAWLAVAGVIFFLGYCKTAKMGIVFLILAVPLLQQSLSFLFEDMKRIQVARGAKQILSFLNVSAWVFLASYPLILLLWPAPALWYPASAAAALRSLADEGRVNKLFNYYNWGGYLIWQVPNVKVFIDGRMPHWIDEQGRSAMKDYMKAMQQEKEVLWPEVFARYNIDTAFIPSPSGLKDRLLESKWTEIYTDEIAAILQKNAK